MTEKPRVVVSWSGGKDSALALDELLRGGQHQVVGLLTTVAETHRRVSHHGVREKLLVMQAESLGLPLEVVYLPSGPNDACTFEQYEALMGRKMAEYHKAGVGLVMHGDVFLEDLRRYREDNLAKLGMAALFPLWDRDTAELVHTFIDRGFRAVVTCVDGEKMPTSFAGRPIDAAFLRDLPRGVDPCGENGEYHSFVVDGPIFQRPLEVELGEVVTREGRHFADLLPASGPSH